MANPNAHRDQPTLVQVFSEVAPVLMRHLTFTAKSQLRLVSTEIRDAVDASITRAYYTFRPHEPSTLGALSIVRKLPNLQVLSVSHYGAGSVQAEAVPAAIASAPVAATLHTLHLIGVQLGDEGAEWLAWAAMPCTLRTLQLSSAGIGTRGVAALCNFAPWWSALTALDLGGNKEVGANACAVLRQSRYVTQLRRLRLGGTNPAEADAAAAHLAAAPWPHLSLLELSQPSCQGIATILASTTLCSLRSLRSLRTEAADALHYMDTAPSSDSSSPSSAADSLQHLQLVGRALNSQGLRALLAEFALPRLRVLELDSDDGSLNDDIAAAISSTPWFACLASLNLHCATLSMRSMRALFPQTRPLPRLMCLGLSTSRGPIGAAVLHALASNLAMPHLQTMMLESDGGFDTAAAMAVTAGPWPHLETLELHSGSSIINEDAVLCFLQPSGCRWPLLENLVMSPVGFASDTASEFAYVAFEYRWPGIHVSIMS